MDFSNIATVSEVCKYMGGVAVKNPVCVETGSASDFRECNLIHTTTNNILNYICRPNNGILFSLDIEKNHQDITRTLCSGEDCIYLLGDSVQSMRDIRSRFVDKGIFVDVLWLDSKEFDEDHAVNEYNSIKDRLRPGKHFVMVDDIHNLNSVKYKKIVPLLKSLGYLWVEVPTPTGLFISWLGY